MTPVIPKPQNWQDFEELCLRIWRDEWSCPEIIKNGRLGQKQFGVDVYGIPEGKQGYYGIQCKLMHEGGVITEGEIETIVREAEQFSPTLYSMYIATTARKDATIEEIVRLRNTERLKLGKFGINIFFWEDIELRIRHNERILHWYLGIQREKQPDVSLVFKNNKESIILEPQLQLTVVKYNNSERTSLLINQSQYEVYWDEEKDRHVHMNAPVLFFPNQVSYNLSVVEFSMYLVNSGLRALENYSLYFKFFCNQAIGVDVSRKKTSYFDAAEYWYNVEADEDGLWKFFPQDAFLRPHEEISTDPICLKSGMMDKDVDIEWSIHAKDYYKEGQLSIFIRPKLSRNIIASPIPSNLDPVGLLSNVYTTDEAVYLNRLYETV